MPFCRVEHFDDSVRRWPWRAVAQMDHSYGIADRQDGRHCGCQVSAVLRPPLKDATWRSELPLGLIVVELLSDVFVHSLDLVFVAEYPGSQVVVELAVVISVLKVVLLIGDGGVS